MHSAFRRAATRGVRQFFKSESPQAPRAPLAGGLAALRKGCCHDYPDCGCYREPRAPIMLLTGSMAGHQHGVLIHLDPQGSWNPSNGGHTEHATSEGMEHSHGHAWVWTPDGRIEIAESEGHTHSLDGEAVGRLLLALAGR